jgi:hypothetical protein
MTWLGRQILQETNMADESKPKKTRRPDPNEELVKVFDSEEESEALVVKGLLDSAGVESDLKSGTWVQEMFPGLGGMVILVREEDAEEARRIIAESQRTGSISNESSPDSGGENDDDATAEFPAQE